MQAGLRFELLILSMGLVLVLLIGTLSNQLSLCLFVFLIFYLTWQLRVAWVFASWVNDNMKGSPDQHSGIWRDLAKVLVKRKQQQDESIKRMREAVKRTSQLTHAIDEGIIVLQRDMRLSWWNKVAKEQMGLEASDRGHLLTSLVRNPLFNEYLGQKKIKGRLELPSRVNPEKWLMFTASHFGDGDIVLVISDITPLKNTERLRKEFVANVSHELRTPMTVLRGYLETLSDSEMSNNPLVQKALNHMSDQVLRMQNLADDLIVLSRLESQPEKLKKRKIELQPLLEGIVNEAGIVSEGKHQFNLECSESLNMFAQESDIHSVISNLVNNAVHHNPKGARIDIKVNMDKDYLCILVKDDGIGITADALPRLTERFYRTDSGRSSRVGGSGLGLAIVKHVINRYNGKLDIKSRFGEGAEFICYFPLSKQ